MDNEFGSPLKNVNIGIRDVNTYSMFFELYFTLCKSINMDFPSIKYNDSLHILRVIKTSLQHIDGTENRIRHLMLFDIDILPEGNRADDKKVIGFMGCLTQHQQLMNPDVRLVRLVDRCDNIIREYSLSGIGATFFKNIPRGNGCIC
jgi:hypothetical protein